MLWTSVTLGLTAVAVSVVIVLAALVATPIVHPEDGVTSAGREALRLAGVGGVSDTAGGSW